MKLLSRHEVNLLHDDKVFEKAVSWDESITGSIVNGLISGVSFLSGKIGMSINSKRIDTLLMQWSAEYIAAIDKVYRVKIKDTDEFIEMGDEDDDDDLEDDNVTDDIGDKTIDDSKEEIKQNIELEKEIDTEKENDRSADSIKIFNDNSKAVIDLVNIGLEEIKNIIKADTQNESIFFESFIFEAISDTTKNEVLKRFEMIFSVDFIFNPLIDTINNMIEFSEMSNYKQNLTEYINSLTTIRSEFVAKYVDGIESNLEKWDNDDFSELENDIKDFVDLINEINEYLHNLDNEEINKLLDDTGDDDDDNDLEKNKEDSDNVTIKNIQVVINKLTNLYNDVRKKTKSTSSSKQTLNNLRTLYTETLNKILTEEFYTALEPYEEFNETNELIHEFKTKKEDALFADLNKYDDLMNLKHVFESSIELLYNLISLIENEDKLTKRDYDKENKDKQTNKLQQELRKLKKLYDILDVLIKETKSGSKITTVLTYKYDEKFNEILDSIELDTKKLKELNNELNVVFDSQKGDKYDPNPFISIFDKMKIEISNLFNSTKNENIYHLVYNRYYKYNSINEGLNDWFQKMKGDIPKRGLSYQIDNLYETSRIEELAKIKDIKQLVLKEMNLPRLNSIRYEVNTIIEDATDKEKKGKKGVSSKDLKRKWEKGILEISDKFQKVIDTPTLLNKVKGEVDSDTKTKVENDNEMYTEIQELHLDEVLENGDNMNKTDMVYCFKSSLSMDKVNNRVYNLFVSPLDKDFIVNDGDDTFYIMKLHNAYKYDKRKSKIVTANPFEKSTNQNKLYRNFGSGEYYLAYYKGMQKPKTYYGIVFDNKGDIIHNNTPTDIDEVSFNMGKNLESTLKNMLESGFVFKTTIQNRFVVNKEAVDNKKFDKLSLKNVENVDNKAKKKIINTLEKILKK